MPLAGETDRSCSTMQERIPIEEEAQRAAGPLRATLEEAGLPLPSWGIVLGSGLHSPPFSDAGYPSLRWEFEGLPGLHPPTVPGHPGSLEACLIEGIPALLQRGRIHYYETRDLRPVCLPVFLMREMGVCNLILTNAAGGLDPSFRPGEFMLVRDHINLMGTNPLLELAEGRPAGRFLDLSATYDRGLGDRLLFLAKGCGVSLREGVLVAVQGPVYETPAESRFLRAIGGDAVSMSLVPEAVCARFLGMRVAGLSCITNVHSLRESAPLSHKEVLEAASGSAPILERLLRSLIASMG